MELSFNNAGPIKPGLHYHIDPLTRLDWEEVRRLIDGERYFVLHAPRQTGKTSTLLTMMRVLNEEGRYACAYANIEAAQAARGDETQGILAACSAVSSALGLYTRRPEMKQWYLKEGRQFPPQDQFFQLLNHWTATSDKHTVLFLDEVDALVGDTLISLLRQIRAGYTQRPEAFPQSIVLCGVRDVRDYRIHQGVGEIITGGSAFNIKAKSLRMGNFTPEESKALWVQHHTCPKQQKSKNSLLILKDLQPRKLKFQNEVPSFWKRRKPAWLLGEIRFFNSILDKCGAAY